LPDASRDSHSENLAKPDDGALARGFLYRLQRVSDAAAPGEARGGARERCQDPDKHIGTMTRVREKLEARHIDCSIPHECLPSRRDDRKIPTGVRRRMVGTRLVLTGVRSPGPRRRWWSSA
jgi:hypothetical protein